MTRNGVQALSAAPRRPPSNMRRPAARPQYIAPQQAVDLPYLVLDQASVAVVASDMKGRVTYVNRGAQELYGTTYSKAVGRAVKDIVALPDDRHSVDDIVESV